MPSDVSATADDALTLDMVGQYTYCPRRFHLMYVEGRWADNEFTIEGRKVHRLVDKVDHLLPGASSDDLDSEDKPDTDKPVVGRSVPLGSDTLGLTAKLDLVATDGDEAVPVETKRGKVPNNEARSYETQRVQLMAQGLLLREHGYNVSHGMIYFAGSRTRVTVPFTAELETRTRELIQETQKAALLRIIPEPLNDDPRCNGCSLSPICMPDETLALRSHTATDNATGETAPDESTGKVRRFYPIRAHQTPLYVQEQGAKVAKDKRNLVVSSKGKELTRVRLKDISQVVLCGNVQVSTQTVHFLCEHEVPVVYLSTGMWFHGITHGFGLRNAYDRAAQFLFASQPDRCLVFARQIVKEKGLNQRTQLRRNAPDSREKTSALAEIDGLLFRLPSVTSLEILLGMEGSIARAYFSQFASMLKSSTLETSWEFNSRNRRPPKDPVNALLSFAYALLAKECTVALLSEGLDPYWGFYHQPRHGRPALALDIMEPLRPLIADSVVITAINTGMVRESDFEKTSAGCAMNDRARKSLLKAYESRLDHLVTHPVFDYRSSWRTVIRMQARLLSRFLRGDIPRFEGIVTR